MIQTKILNLNGKLTLICPKSVQKMIESVIFTICIYLYDLFLLFFKITTSKKVQICLNFIYVTIYFLMIYNEK